MQVQRDDALPLQVCINCVLRLDAFHQMTRVCSEADKKLRCYFNETQSYVSFIFNINNQGWIQRSALGVPCPAVLNLQQEGGKLAGVDNTSCAFWGPSG